MFYPSIFDNKFVESGFFTKEDFLSFGIDYNLFSHCHQIHSDILLEAKTLGEQGNCDALWTDKKGLKCGVYVADCVPILYYIADENKKIVGVIHSGWKGTVKNIVSKVFLQLKQKFYKADQSYFKKIYIWLGPSICKNCYEFGPEAESIFPKKYIFPYKDGKFLVDIKGQILDQIQNLGIPFENIENCKICSYENQNLCFSYRRDKDKSRMYAWIKLI